MFVLLFDGDGERCDVCLGKLGACLVLIVIHSHRVMDIPHQAMDQLRPPFIQDNLSIKSAGAKSLVLNHV